MLRVLDGGEVVGEMPVEALVDDCPLYDLSPGAAGGRLYPAPAATLAADVAIRARSCSRCSRSPNIASRLPLFEQYDCIVQSRTVRRPEQADAAVLAAAGRRRRDRGLDRRLGPARGVRPVHGHGRGGARVHGEPRVRRRRAARA